MPCWRSLRCAWARGALGSVPRTRASSLTSTGLLVRRTVFSLNCRTRPGYESRIYRMSKSAGYAQRLRVYLSPRGGNAPLLTTRQLRNDKGSLVISSDKGVGWVTVLGMICNSRRAEAYSSLSHGDSQADPGRVLRAHARFRRVCLDVREEVGIHRVLTAWARGGIGSCRSYLELPVIPAASAAWVIAPPRPVMHNAPGSSPLRLAPLGAVSL